MKFILTKRFMGLIAYSVLTFWMVFYGDMASKIIGVSAEIGRASCRERV